MDQESILSRGRQPHEVITHDLIPPGITKEAYVAKLEAYWTPARTQEAKAVEIPIAAEERLISPPREVVAITTEVADYSKPPYDAIGRFSYTLRSKAFNCSASIIGPYHILTAAHCIYPHIDAADPKNPLTGPNRQWAANIIFNIGYKDGQYVKRAYGLRIFILKDWVDLTEDCPSLDIAIVETTEPMLGFTTLGILYSDVSAGDSVKQLGYPASPNGGFSFNGEQMWQCDTQLELKPAAKQWNIESPMTGGASGGPWLKGLSVCSVTSQRDLNAPTMFGPIFGDQMKSLITAANSAAIKYTTNLGSNTFHVAVGDEQKTYFGGNGYVYQLDRLGRILATNGLAGYRYQPVTLFMREGNLYLGTYGWILSIDPKNFTNFRWQKSLPGSGWERVEVYDFGDCMGVASNGYVYKYDFYGNLLEKNDLPGYGNSFTQMTTNGFYYFVGINGWACSISPQDFTKVQSFQKVSDLAGKVNILSFKDSSWVYTGCNGKVHMLGVQHYGPINSIKEIANFGGGQLTEVNLATDGRVLYAAARGRVKAWDIGSETEKWSTTVSTSAEFTYLALAGLTLAVEAQGTVWQLNAVTGNLMGRVGLNNNYDEIAGMACYENRDLFIAKGDYAHRVELSQIISML